MGNESWFSRGVCRWNRRPGPNAAWGGEQVWSVRVDVWIQSQGSLALSPK